MSKNEIVIIDTEYTTWEGAMESGWAEDWQHREIIEIAAIKVDPATGEETGTLDVIVKPKINSTLSGFCTELTSITQDRIDNEGCRFEEALNRLVEFCDGIPASHIITYGRDEYVLMENCDINNIDYPFKEPWRNLRPALASMGIDHKQYNSGALHTLTDTPLGGHAHYALHDVRSIAVFIRYQMRQGHTNIVSDFPKRGMAP